MSWSLYRWVWLVESPLAVGVPPAGALNRCRLYVPARTLWGALTAERARANAGAVPPAYEEMGNALARETRLTYLFPAESVGDEWLAWLPRYEEGRGLVWCSNDGQPADDRSFRHRLVTTRVSTAIEPRSNTAAEGSLRETECVNNRWRDNRSRVAMVGYVFVRKSAGLPAEQNFRIQVGGDTRYGLGRLRCIEIREESNVFAREVCDGEGEPSVVSWTVLAHADAAGDAEAEPLGSLEVLSGWDRSRLAASGDGQPLWAPGSSWNQERCWEITSDGIWKLASSTD